MVSKIDGFCETGAPRSALNVLSLLAETPVIGYRIEFVSSALMLAI
jgi:hypothetical protein